MADPHPERCKAQTKSGSRCGNSAREDGYCHITSHKPDAPHEQRDQSDPYWRLKNDRQRKFVDEYCIDGNGAGAARRAGYQGDPGALASTAYNLLTNTDIRDAIDERLAKQSLTKAEATAFLGRVARSSLSPFLRVVEREHEDDDGNIDVRKRFRVDFTSEEAQANFHLLKEVKFDANMLPSIKTHDQMKAVELILKMYGAFVVNIEHSGPDGGPIEFDDFDPSNMTDDELAELDQHLTRVEQLMEQADGNESHPKIGPPTAS